jgi:hypothetical protein
MIQDEDETGDKTPPVTPGTPDAVKTPRPLSLVPRRPPPGRPSASLSVSELVERITRDVRSTLPGEIDRRHDQLRDELVGGVRIATGLGVAAIAMNVVAILANLASSRALPAGGVSLAVAALTALFLGAARAGVRRGQSAR